MNFQEMINKVSSTVNKGITATTKGIPLEYAYLAYKVSKAYAIENVNENGNIKRDLYLYTYIENEPSILAKMEDGTYKDLVNNVKYKGLEYTELISKHIFRSDNINLDEYPKLSKNDCIGIFNPINFEEIVDYVIDKELNSKDINLKISTQKKKSYTIVEMESIYKKYKDMTGENTSSLVKYIIVPPIKIDELDNIKTPYNLESEFLYMYYMQDQKIVYNDIKQKSSLYSVMKNGN